MSKFDEFDLDLQSIKANTGAGPQSYTVTNNCTTATIDSIAHCTQSGDPYMTCFCSTCCTGYTVPC